MIIACFSPFKASIAQHKLTAYGLKPGDKYSLEQPRFAESRKTSDQRNRFLVPYQRKIDPESPAAFLAHSRVYPASS
jgi:hypothetical protein